MLKLLERLSDTRLDELRQQLAGYYNDHQKLTLRMEKLVQDLILERERIQYDQAPYEYFFSFLLRTQEEITHLRQQLMVIDQEIEILMERVREEYHEGKKIDLTLQNVYKELKREEEYQEQRFLDQLATLRHRHSLS